MFPLLEATERAVLWGVPAVTSLMATLGKAVAEALSSVAAVVVPAPPVEVDIEEGWLIIEV